MLDCSISHRASTMRRFTFAGGWAKIVFAFITARMRVLPGASRLIRATWAPAISCNKSVRLSSIDCSTVFVPREKRVQAQGMPRSKIGLPASRVPEPVLGLGDLRDAESEPLTVGGDFHAASAILA